MRGDFVSPFFSFIMTQSRWHMSDIDIRLHIEFDGDTYIKQMSSLDDRLQQLHSLGGYGKRLKVGGRQKASKKFIQEFKSLLADEVIDIATDITYDLIEGTGGTTGNTASAWTVTLSKSSLGYQGYLGNNPQSYFSVWKEAVLNNTNFVGEGQANAEQRLGSLTGQLHESMRSNYTVHISNCATVDEGKVEGFRKRTITIGGEHYASRVIRDGAGFVPTDIDDPEQYAMTKFEDQMKNAIRRVRYALRNMKKR